MRKRNAKIELMRFVFATSVILFHISGKLWDRKKVLFSIGETQITLFRNGSIGVEFFFLVSGFLMAKSVYRRMTEEQGGRLAEPVGVETVRFLWGKVKALWPYYLPACLLGFLMLQFTDKSAQGAWFVQYLPSLFFLQETGISDFSFTGVPSWYISSMLIAMAVLYPFCRKFYHTFTTLFAPVFGILVAGALILLNGNLAGTGQDWWGITYACNFRALGEIALGTTCFEVSRRISQVEFSTGKRLLFSLAEVAGYALALFYACCYTDRKFSGQILFVLCIAVTISFSEVGYFSNRRPIRSALFVYLGALSLPMYLMQIFFLRLVPIWWPGLRPGMLLAAMYGSILLAGILMHEIISRLQKRKRA